MVQRIAHLNTQQDNQQMKQDVCIQDSLPDSTLPIT